MNPNIETQRAPQMGGFTIADLASALGVTRRTIRDYIRKGWIEAKPVKWRKQRTGPNMMAYEWLIPSGEYRRIVRDGIRPPASTFDAMERAAAHTKEVG